MHISTVWVVVGLVSSVIAQVDQQPTAERRVGQNGNGTFFQPFINGINTFFNPSQFRNPLNQFRNPTRNQQQSQQQFSTQQFPPQTQPRQPQQQQSQFNQQQFGSSQQQQFNFQDFRNNPTFQQDFQITRFPEGSVTSEQQFSTIPRQQPQSSQPQFQQVQPAQQPQSNRFNPGFSSPSVRPFTDNVPTVPAVTSFDRFRPSEATANAFRFQPSQTPEFSQDNSNSAIFPPRLQVEQAAFPNSHTVRVPPTFSLRPDVATSPSVEPVSISGIINRNPSIQSSESEITGTAFRGRKRLRPRFGESSETGSRSRVRNKVKISILEDDDEEEEEESDTVPPTTSSRGRLRSRFSGSAPRSLKSKADSRPRLPTGPRVVPTGKRRRQKFGKNRSEEENDDDIEDNNLPEEEDRRSANSAPRRKLNRLPGQFTSRRKTTNPTEAPVTRIPSRRRFRPSSFGKDQESPDFQTESPQFFIDDDDEETSSEVFSTTNENGISVLPISTFGELEHHALHAHVQAAGVDDESEPVPSTAPPPSIFFDGFRVSPAVPIIQVCLFT